MNSRRSNLGALCLAALATLPAAANCFAGSTSFIGPAGSDWNNAANWSGGAVPAPGDTVSFAPAGSNTYYYDAFESPQDAGELNVVEFGDPSIPSAPTVVQNTGVLNAEIETCANGSFEQSAGVNICSSGFEISVTGATDTYVLTGGALLSNYTSVGNGGSGTLLQSGSGVSDLGLCLLGESAPAYFSLSGGTAAASALYIGYSGVATYSQSGSGFMTTGAMYVGFNTNGTALLSGGVLNSGSTLVGDFSPGLLAQSGSLTVSSLGSLQIGNFAQDGSLTLSGGTLIAASTVINQSGNATFSQQGGFSNLGALQIGTTGPYTAVLQLSGGTLSASTTAVGTGAGATGTFAQSGSLSVSNLGTLQIGGAGNGTLLLEGGSLIASSTSLGSGTNVGFLSQGGGSSNLGTLIVGAQGVGSLALSGGSLTATSTAVGSCLVSGSSAAGTFSQGGGSSNLGSLFIGVGFGSPGTLELSAGTLVASSTDLGVISSAGTFIQTGGVASLGVATFGGASNPLSNLVSLSAGTLGATQTGMGQHSRVTYLQSGSQSFAELGTLTVGSLGTLSLSGGTLDVQTITSSGTLLVSGGTLAITGAGSLGTGSITNISISNSGVLDLGTSGLVMPYTGATPVGELNPSHHTQNYPANSVQRYLQTAIDGGNWDGPGISSSAAEADFTGTTAVGAVDNSDLLDLQGNNYTGKTWLGKSITSDNTVLVRFTYFGDTNLDGVVNSLDVDNLIQGFEGFGDGWLYGDFNYDGIVDSLDVTELIIGYTGQGKPLGDAISPGQAQFLLSLSSGLSAAQIAKFDQVVGVPEPACLGLIGLATTGLLGRRRAAIR